MKCSLRWTWAPAVGVVITMGASARAQDSAAAEALFDKGVAAMAAGKYEIACPSLAESNRLEPRPGTMFALADCEAKWGKVATAVVYYTDYLRSVSQLPNAKQNAHADRKRMAQQSIAKLKPTVPQLSLVLPPGAPADTVVRRDGQLLGTASLSTPLPVDPGDHLIVTQVPGGPEHTMHVPLRAGESRSVTLEIERATAGTIAPAASSSVPKAGAAKPEEHAKPEKVLVHLIGPNVVVEYNTSSASAWQRACETPCDVQLPTAAQYRITGSGVDTSAPFNLLVGDSTRRVNLDVSVARPGLFGLGVAGTAVGGLGFLGGLVAAYVGLIESATGHDSGTLTGGLVVAGTGLAISIPSIILLATNSSSKVKQESSGQARRSPAFSAMLANKEQNPGTIPQRQVSIPILSGRF